MPRAVIVGAGISGLALGAGLRGAGWDVEVLERAIELKAAGSGITLWPNALTALDELGSGARVRAAGVALEHGYTFDRSGRKISEKQTGALAERFEPCRTLHRTTLLNILVDTLGKDAVRLGADVVAVHNDTDRAAVELNDGSRVEGDLVFGADGVRSMVRTAIFRDAPAPQPTGAVCLRGVVRRESVDSLPGPTTSTESWGDGAYFGICPLPEERVYWYAAAPGMDVEQLASTFSDWHQPVPSLVRPAVNVEPVLAHPIDELPPLHTWSTGRVVLLGDAAHAMAPAMGQGACQSIEDALALTNVLATFDGTLLGERLRTYEHVRKPRAELVQRRSSKALATIRRRGLRANVRDFFYRHEVVGRTGGGGKRLDICVPAVPPRLHARAGER